VKSAERSQPICSYLEWDSDFFGCRIARANRTRLDPVEFGESLAWCGANRIDCLYLLAESDDPLTTQLAEKNQFLLADVRMTFVRSLSDSLIVPASAVVREAREEDLGALRLIALKAHRDSRFYFDPHFDRAKCDLLYETWIEKSIRGFAKEILVAEVDRKTVAYVTINLNGSEAQIGLLGVAEGHQGAGVGSRLVTHSLSWAAEAGAKRVSVVTQGRNVRAQRLYQRNGFVTRSSQLWYHRWFSTCAETHLVSGNASGGNK
jgi:dTDP-4-amino-4,6-dideoxy-D-galactose acyltransferase